LVFDLGGSNLFDVVSMTCLHPLPKRQLREMATQLLRGLHFLHSLNIVHTDIKPHNIVLRSSGLNNIRRMRPDGFFLNSVELYIVDFGDAVILEKTGSGVVGTDAYRAPEVTLGLPWTAAIDVFATGCVVVELYLGRPVFHHTATDIERLALLERVLGPFPEHVARSVEHSHSGTFVINPAVRVRFPRPEVKCKDEVKRVMGAWPLSALVFDMQYLELCSELMTLDPRHRQDVRRILASPFLQSCDDEFLVAEPWESRAIMFPVF
ncbi:kinase-like protein, partial [Polyporus arcularius HHB13444]